MVSGIALQDIKILMTGLGYLKGPKLEIFDSRVFPQIRPVWVGDFRGGVVLDFLV
jgi:hypothetical protein